MGLLFVDSCDSYTTSTDISRRWSGGAVAPTQTLYNATAGRSGGGALHSINTSQSIKTGAIFVGNINVRMCVGCWIKISAIPSAQLNAFDFRSFSDVQVGGLSITNVTGYPRLVNTSIATLVTGITPICDNAWHWLEFCHSLNNAAVVLSCYVDSILQWTGQYGVGTTPGITGMYLTFPPSATMSVDDIIMYDDQTAVSPKLTDFPLGPRVVSTLRPNGDSAVQFATNGANNYGRLNEQAQDGDVSYVQDNVSGHADEYNFDDLAYTPASINSMLLTAILRNPGVGTISHKLRNVSGVTTTDTAAATTPSAYAESKVIYDRDPNTSAAWTTTNLNAAKFGVVVP